MTRHNKAAMDSHTRWTEIPSAPIPRSRDTISYPHPNDYRRNASPAVIGEARQFTETKSIVEVIEITDDFAHLRILDSGKQTCIAGDIQSIRLSDLLDLSRKIDQ